MRSLKVDEGVFHRPRWACNRVVGLAGAGSMDFSAARYGYAMKASEWAGSQVENLSDRETIVWIEDPYRLLTDEAILDLEKRLASVGTSIVRADNAFRLRERLNELDPLVSRSRLVIIDRSYTVRDDNELPRDAKSIDLLPLAAPDWLRQVATDARRRLTVQSFLTAVSGYGNWPSQVNIFPYEKLARESPAPFIRAFETFRRSGRTITDEDLIVVGASALFEIDLFDLTSPYDALWIGFHESWDRFREFFNERELSVLRAKLCELPIPLGDLFGSNAGLARTAVISLLVLQQHFPDTAGHYLEFLSPTLARYRDARLPIQKEVPSWFVDDEIPRFEELCTDQFLAHLRSVLRLDEPDQARKFVQDEQMSQRLRSLAPFELQPARGVADATAEASFELGHLVPEFRQFKAVLHKLVQEAKRPIESLKLRPDKEISSRDLLNVFVDQRFYRSDRIVGRLQRLIADIEGPARRKWSLVPGFEDRWNKEVRECRDLIVLAGRLRDDLDLRFGRLLESRFGEMVPEEILQTDKFYADFIAPRRRNVDGKLSEALVLVVDSMRFDIWRELLRPALEHEYACDEQIGFAVLPSMTEFSRRAFFAGQPPALLPPSGKESDLFAELLKRTHGHQVTFEEVPHKRQGMVFGVRSRGDKDKTWAAVFDFPDALSHEVDWDPHTLQEAQRPLIREVQALLAEVEPDCLVFVTADHGHILQSQGARVNLDGAQDVGYRSAYSAKRVEGKWASALFQIPAQVLRHNRPGWWLFPRPGYALYDASRSGGRFQPTATYRHGGLSMFEVVVPLACLRHRKARVNVRLSFVACEAVRVGEPSFIEVSVSADGTLASPLLVTSDNEAIESATVGEVSSIPKVVRLEFAPTAPGGQRITVTAWLGGAKVGQCQGEVEVLRAARSVDSETVAKAKLLKLFGDE